jgi:hypothetical protein
MHSSSKTRPILFKVSRIRISLFLLLLLTLVTLSFFSCLGLVSASAASANGPVTHTVGGAFPNCNKSVKGKIINVGGQRYQCVCVEVIKGEPCQYVWKNLDATTFASLEIDQGVLISSNLTGVGKANLYFQPDNNLVVYDENGNARWASGTVGKANIGYFQADGNFVLYNGSNQPTWSSKTCCHSGNTLAIQPDGNVVIYDSSHHPLWATNTAH